MDAELFVWGHYHRALITRHARRTKLDAHKLAARCGYTNIDRFQRRRAAWSRGRPLRKALIPVAYLDAIGVDVCELVDAVERDRVEYERALEQLPLPDFATAPLPAALPVCVRTPLPYGLTMKELYAHVQRMVDSGEVHGGKAILSWPSMKCVWFFKDRPPREFTWPPRFVAVGDRADFGSPVPPG
jgi:hypothetical protein